MENNKSELIIPKSSHFDDMINENSEFSSSSSSSSSNETNEEQSDVLTKDDHYFKGPIFIGGNQLFIIYFFNIS